MEDFDKAIQFAKSGKLGEALEICRDLVERNPDEIRPKLLLLDVLLNLGNENEAIVLSDEIKARFPENLRVYDSLGSYYDSKNRFQEAVVAYEEATAKASDIGYYYYRLASLFNDYANPDRDEKKYLELLRKSISVDQPHPRAFLQLARVETQGRGLIILEKGLEIFPEESSILEALAHGYRVQKRFIDLEKLVQDSKEQSKATNTLNLVFALALHDQERFVEANDVLRQVVLQSYSDSEKLVLEMLSTVFLIDGGQLPEAIRIIRQIIREDIENSLDYLPNWILVLALLCQGKAQNALVELQEIPLRSYRLIDYYLPTNINYLVFDFDKHVIKALDQLINVESDNERLTARASAFYSLHKYSAWEDESYSVYPEDEEKFADQLLELEQQVGQGLKYFHDIPALKLINGKILFQKGEKIKAAKEFMVYSLTQERGFVETGIYEELHESDEDIATYFSYIDDLVLKSHRWRPIFVKKMLEEITEYFFKSEAYEWVTRLGRKFSYFEQLEAEILFFLAYSSSQIGDSKKAKELYESYLVDVKEDPAVVNNLGVLYEEEGDLDKAENFFKQAMELGNEKAEKNLQRVQGNREHQRKLDEEYSAARHVFKQETKDNQHLIAQFTELTTPEGLIYLNPRQFSSLAGYTERETIKKIEEFEDKKYLRIHRDHVLIENGFVLEINENLSAEVSTISMSLKDQSEATQLAQKLSTENLSRQLGYNSGLLEKLEWLHSSDLRSILERDLFEAALALAVRSSKTVLVLCGSIIEAILLDMLMANENESLQHAEKIWAKGGKNLPNKLKNLDNWDLFLLLDVASRRDLISSNLFHLCNGLRGFRNLIHPGVEKRQDAKVDYESAYMSWSITKRLINELSQTN